MWRAIKKYVKKNVTLEDSLFVLKAKKRYNKDLAYPVSEFKRKYCDEIFDLNADLKEIYLEIINQKLMSGFVSMEIEPT